MKTHFYSFSFIIISQNMTYAVFVLRKTKWKNKTSNLYAFELLYTLVHFSVLNIYFTLPHYHKRKMKRKRSNKVRNNTYNTHFWTLKQISRYIHVDKHKYIHEFDGHTRLTQVLISELN